MATEGPDDVTAMLLTEISAALAATLKLALDRATPSDGSNIVPPAAIYAFYTEVLEQNIELLQAYADRFASEGRADLQTWCEGMMTDAQRQLALLDPWMSRASRCRWAGRVRS